MHRHTKSDDFRLDLAVDLWCLESKYALINTTTAKNKTSKDISSINEDK